MLEAIEGINTLNGGAVSAVGISELSSRTSKSWRQMKAITHSMEEQ
jgi:hypothetical protein